MTKISGGRRQIYREVFLKFQFVLVQIESENGSEEVLLREAIPRHSSGSETARSGYSTAAGQSSLVRFLQTATNPSRSQSIPLLSLRQHGIISSILLFSILIDSLYVQGFCRYGDSCKYLHPVPNNNVQQPPIVTTPSPSPGNLIN